MSPKILVAAKRLAPDSSSEGICSLKYVLALASAGYQVLCVTTEGFSEGRGISPTWWPESVGLVRVQDVTGTGTRARIAQASSELASTGKIGAYVDRKLNAVCAYGTGHSFHVWHIVERWRRAIHRAVETYRPDYIIVRGAGSEFEPHMAMLTWRPSVPWVAHYHDPYPFSLYPEPYRHHVPVLSRHQEAIHRQIVASADVLTFPCERLLKWVLCGGLEVYRDKAFVVPHIASDLGEAILTRGTSRALSRSIVRPGCFNLVHTGTLLHQRDPRGLLRGFLDFVRQDDERRRLARLVFVGRVDRTHADLPEWKELVSFGNLEAIDRRVSYGQALDIARAADVLVLLEADCSESPFYPAKLADYLYLRRPILALSPSQSGTGDVLGPEYPLRVSPNDGGAVTHAVNTLWQRWTAGRLDECLPSERSRQTSSEAAVQCRLQEIFDFSSSVEQRRVS